jgi:N-acetylglucosamine malate deacetylase 2
MRQLQPLRLHHSVRESSTKFAMTPQEMLARATAPEDSTSTMPNALLVFAHQDDEVIALGARMARFSHAHMVHVTDGAPRDQADSRAHGFAALDDYRLARANELHRALHLAGLEHMSRECLAIPDQEAALRLPELTRAILQRIQVHRPDVIFTHPYEGGHPDHDACAFAVHHARTIYAQPGATAPQGATAPLVIESGFYHAGPHGIETGAFLRHSSPGHEISYSLSPEEQKRKQLLIECFTTQRATLSSFSLTEERFRIAPDYDFTRPPHPAPVFYDQFPWGMTSDRFCKLAGEAQQLLRTQQGVPCR